MVFMTKVLKTFSNITIFQEKSSVWSTALGTKLGIRGKFGTAIRAMAARFFRAAFGAELPFCLMTAGAGPCIAALRDGILCAAFGAEFRRLKDGGTALAAN